MRRFVYTAEMLLFLENGFKRHRIPKLTNLFNEKFSQQRKESQIRAAVKNHKFRCGRKPGFTNGENITLLTPEQIKFVTEKYPELSRKEMLAALNKRFGLSLRLSQLVSFVKNHKIRSGRTGQYGKGNRPHNTGTRGVMKANSGSFKKGSRPTNYQPIGFERLTKDGYIEVKVSDRNPWKSSQSGWYRLKQIVVWERHNGVVPEGMCLRFKDGSRANCDIDNLMLVSRGENARLNSMGYNGQPDELKPVVLAIAKVDQAVYEKI